MHKKNIILIFLLCLVAMPLFFSVYTMIEKKIIEHRMQGKLEQECLQTITLEASAVTWLKKNKELLINGEPFDVSSMSRNGESITVTGLFDNQEKKLEEQLERYNHSQERSASSKNSLLLLFFTTWYQTNEPIDLTTPFFVYKKQAPQKHRGKTCKLYQEIIIPPPRTI